jgi:hypothetical protein
MFKDSVEFRRIASGVLLIVAPLLQIVAVLVDPGTWGDDRETVSYADNPVLAQLQSVLYHWSWLLTALAAFGLLHLVRRRGVVLGHIAGAMTVVGYISISALLLTDPVEWWFGQHYPVEEAQRLSDEMLSLPGVIFGFQLPWVYLGLLGLPLLIVAVWRAGAVHWWVPLAVCVGAVSTFLPYGPAIVPLWVSQAVGIGSIGVRVLRMDRVTWASYYPAVTSENAASPTL